MKVVYLGSPILLRRLRRDAQLWHRQMLCFALAHLGRVELYERVARLARYDRIFGEN